MVTGFAIRHAAHCIRHGGVIVYPTETIYGLGCDPLCEDAIKRINRIKQRPPGKGLILLAGRLEQLDDFINVPSPRDRDLIRDNAQPISWIVPARPNTRDWITGGGNTVAVRVSDHAVVYALCEQLGFPLVSTSANPAGRKPARNALALHHYFDGIVDAMLIATGACSGTPSKIIRLVDRSLVRE
jgi:L-threonylcarbamoyladenylate synthase